MLQNNDWTTLWGMLWCTNRKMWIRVHWVPELFTQYDLLRTACAVQMSQVKKNVKNWEMVQIFLKKDNYTVVLFPTLTWSIESFLTNQSYLSISTCVYIYIHSCGERHSREFNLRVPNPIPSKPLTALVLFVFQNDWMISKLIILNTPPFIVNALSEY